MYNRGAPNFSFTALGPSLLAHLLLQKNNMETEGPFVKVPIECVSQVFRKTRKTVSEKMDQKRAAGLLGIRCAGAIVARELFAQIMLDCNALVLSC